MRNLFLLLFFVPLLTLAQKKQITLEDIYKKSTFRSEPFGGFAGEDNSGLFDPKEIKDEAGQAVNTQDYQVSADKKRIIFFTGKEAIYRRSSKATVYLYDVASKKTTRLT